MFCVFFNRTGVSEQFEKSKKLKAMCFKEWIAGGPDYTFLEYKKPSQTTFNIKKKLYVCFKKEKKKKKLYVHFPLSVVIPLNCSVSSRILSSCDTI